MKTWILVANSAEAKILTTDNLRVGELEITGEYTHLESRKKISELMTDKPGHYKIDTNAHGAYGKKNPKEVEAEHFALQLAHELKTKIDQNHGQCKKILIITPAHFYGLIKKHLHLPNIIDEAHILKDYTKYTLRELHETLKKQLLI